MNLFKDYVSPILKWWWLVLTVPIIAALSAYFFAQQLPSTYQSRITLLIGRAIQDPNPSSTEFNMSYQLANEYADMAKREPVQNAVKEALGLTKLPDYEATARGIFLEISVIHTDPKFAEVVANIIGQKIIDLSPASTMQTSSEDQLFVQNQLKELQTSIEQTQDEIATKQSRLLGMESALDIAKTESEIKGLEEKLTSLQEIYTNLFASTREAATNTLSIFDPATEPTSPIGPKRVLIVALAALSGLVFALAAAYLIEFLDDTIKSTDEIERVTDVPTIGAIAEMHGGFKPTFSWDQPRSPIADAFRSLRTNLEFSAVDHPLRKLVVSSAEASDGKSTIAMNLAIVMAQAEKSVILLDADLRSPSIHRFLGIPESPGLSDVFLDRVKVENALVEWSGSSQIKIMPAGITPPNSAELLGSHKMDVILDELAGMADFVIVDGPPGFVVDAVVLAAKVDGVLLVVNIGETRRGPIKGVIDQFRRIGANLVGIVLNRIARSASYYGSYYYSSYYSREPATRPVKTSARKLWKIRLKHFSLRSIFRFLPSRQSGTKFFQSIGKGFGSIFGGLKQRIASISAKKKVSTWKYPEEGRFSKETHPSTFRNDASSAMASDALVDVAPEPGLLSEVMADEVQIPVGEGIETASEPVVEPVELPVDSVALSVDPSGDIEEFKMEPVAPNTEATLVSAPKPRKGTRKVSTKSRRTLKG